MAENEASAVKVSGQLGADVKHTMRAANLLYSAPRFILRGPIYLVFIIAFASLVYSFYGKVDTLVTCPMELRADITKVQAPLSGTVNDIYVQEDDQVRAMSNLVDIQYKTDVLKESEVDSVQGQIDKLMDKKKHLAEGADAQKKRVEEMKDQLKALEQKLLDQETDYKKEDEGFEAQLKASKDKIPVLALNKSQAEAEVQKLENSLKVRMEEESDLKKQLTEVEDLLKKQMVTRPEVDAKREQWRRAQESVQTTQTSVSQAQQKVSQVSLELKSLEETPLTIKIQQDRAKIDRGTRRSSISEQISSYKFKIEEMALEMKQSNEDIDKQIAELEKKKTEAKEIMPYLSYDNGIGKVSSSFDGKVINSYIKPGQQIARGEVMFGVWKQKTKPVYARILLLNSDRGRVKELQEVQLKYFSFPYQDYGTRKGKITKISPKPSEKPGEESKYEVEVSLVPEDDEMEMEKREHRPHVPRTLGLQGLAEIKVGEKRLIQIVFKPISKFFADSND